MVVVVCKNSCSVQLGGRVQEVLSVNNIMRT